MLLPRILRRQREMSDVDPLPIIALVALAGADAEAKAERITEYVLEVNPAFPYPKDAGRLLVKIELAGGPPATLFAALITVESRWGAILKRHPWNLSQITQRNQRRMYGRLIRGWVESVKWGAEYFANNLAAAAGSGRKLAEQYWVALAHYNDGPKGTRTRKGQTYAHLVMRVYNEAFGG